MQACAFLIHSLMSLPRTWTQMPGDRGREFPAPLPASYRLKRFPPLGSLGNVIGTSNPSVQIGKLMLRCI